MAPELWSSRSAVRLLCLLGAGARRLAATFALATVVVWVTAVAADSHLVALGPTAFILDQAGTFVTQSGHETMRADGSRQVEYGYWPVAPPDRVVRATLALEDRRFWSHPGVDGLAVGRAVFEHLQGGHGSGASTLAMQVARMQHLRPRTLWAKTVEAGSLSINSLAARCERERRAGAPRVLWRSCRLSRLTMLRPKPPAGSSAG